MKSGLTLCKQTSIMVLTNVMVCEIVSWTLCVWFTRATRVCKSRYTDRPLNGCHCDGRNILPCCAQVSCVHECVTLPFCFVIFYSPRYQCLLIGWATLGDRRKHEFLLMIFHEQEPVDCIFCVRDQYGVVQRHLHYTWNKNMAAWLHHSNKSLDMCDRTSLGRRNSYPGIDRVIPLYQLTGS